MKQYIDFKGSSISPTDLFRFIIIASLTLMCLIITIYSVSRNLGTIYTQLFYFPIIYATYFYPRRGLFLAGACAVVYECFAYAYIFPDTIGMISVTTQALLFVCIGALVAYISEKISTSEIRNRNIVEKSPIGIILFDKNDCKIRLTNTWLEHMLGYTAEDFAGMTFHELLSSDEDRQRFVESVALGKEIQNLETVFATREKEPVRVIFSCSRITENLMSCTVVDINKDLRTPLHPDMGYINRLMKDPEKYGVTDETRIILDRCAKSMDREHRIINQMLELSVIDSGKISLEYSVFSIPDLLKTIIEAGGYTADADITMDVPPDLKFEADKNKISTVIDTMISNAVKYSTPPRKIKIAYRSSPHETIHRLSIKDNGVGITDARLNEIFEPLQIPDSGARNLKFDKIGLSLAIAKKYIKMHGGYISLDSIINIETTFCIHIPKKRQAGS
jgi:PAS domain S-box-containing protein